ncbi:MAG: 16S rRNA (adenine(1518)-N(6)/adenine(1519)-N(6))-dimethyltransferase, partial [Mycobacteriaceae bacterium]|nr:16S rRNA (adenine(1518)-N(6)/adenine(1519)-N(6))-dimethyltransferase [Mycobacteriaceae bacterium]
MAGLRQGSVVTIRYLGRNEIRSLARDLDIRPRKSLGQNFVHDANTLRRVVTIAGVGKADQVLEVGPGLGSLTLALLDRGAAVTAVEIDPMLAERLPQTIAAHANSEIRRLQVLHRDILALRRGDLQTQ